MPIAASGHRRPDQELQWDDVVELPLQIEPPVDEHDEHEGHHHDRQQPGAQQPAPVRAERSDAQAEAPGCRAASGTRHAAATRRRPSTAVIVAPPVGRSTAGRARADPHCSLDAGANDLNAELAQSAPALTPDRRRPHHADGACDRPGRACRGGRRRRWQPGSDGRGRRRPVAVVAHGCCSASVVAAWQRRWWLGRRTHGWSRGLAPAADSRAPPGWLRCWRSPSAMALVNLAMFHAAAQRAAGLTTGRSTCSSRPPRRTR